MPPKASNESVAGSGTTVVGIGLGTVLVADQSAPIVPLSHSGPSELVKNRTSLLVVIGIVGLRKSQRTDVGVGCPDITK